MKNKDSISMKWEGAQNRDTIALKQKEKIKNELSELSMKLKTIKNSIAIKVITRVTCIK